MNWTVWYIFFLFWVVAQLHGWSACNPSLPCIDGVSDCDSDSDCKGNLICFQREKGETRRGYDFIQLPDDADVCVKPGTSHSETILSAPQKIWPKIFGGAEDFFGFFFRKVFLKHLIF